MVINSTSTTVAGEVDWLAWQPVEECPLPLWALMPDADLQDTAALISCNQDIAGDGAFSLGMLADLDRNLVEDGPWAYRRFSGNAA